jgi:methylenetetrahydrofolate dehydrogenase (NADP+)/methenyltetrahydrofolate cyclohydrolase
VQILSGKEVAAKVLAEVKAGVAALRAKTSVQPGLAVVLVGDDPASQIYVRNKKRAADEVGIATRDFLFPGGCSQAELLETIRTINADPTLHGILLQLPLPKGMDEDQAVAAIAPDKDADGLHPMSLGNLLGGKPSAVPCTPAGCIEILDHYGIAIEGAEAVVVGRSRLVGKPLAQLLLARNATVTMCHTRTRDLAAHCRRDDLGRLLLRLEQDGAEIARSLGHQDLAHDVAARIGHQFLGGVRRVVTPDVVVGDEEPAFAELVDRRFDRRLAEVLGRPALAADPAKENVVWNHRRQARLEFPARRHPA